MLQAKYLKYGTCWIVTSLLIRFQLAEFYILKKEFLVLDNKKLLCPPPKIYFDTS